MWDAAGMERPEDFLLVVFGEFSEEGLGSGYGCCGWGAQEMVEADVSPGAAEEVAIGREGDFGEAAEAEQVMQKVDFGFKAQDCGFEGLHRASVAGSLRSGIKTQGE